MAVVTALLLKKTRFKDDSDQFVMELPPYRIPSARNTIIHMWEKAVQYLKKMGSIILVASVIIWVLSYFPTTNAEMEQIDVKIAQVTEDESLDSDSKDAMIEQLEIDKSAAQNKNSYIGQIGQVIEPVVRPLGFDWEMGVSILTGAAAKEIVVSSMGILYHADKEADSDSHKLVTAIRERRNNPDAPITPLVAFGFMVFVLLYYPCIATITAIAKESNWKWAGFSILYTSSVAWIVAFLIHQVGSIFI